MTTSTKTGIYLLLGSNENDRSHNLSRARLAVVNRIGSIVRLSSIYQTKAWGKTDQPDFYNQVIEIATSLSARECLVEILNIENILGRVRTEKWGPRTIDIDILFYHNLCVEETDLIIPHPGIPERRFTLVPLSEIAGEMIHPLIGKSIRTLLNECKDMLAVHKTNEPKD